MDALPQNLRDTVVKLRARIEQFRGRGESIGEQNTKAVLIDPLLSALGWNLQELGEVRREYKYKSQDSPVDYALFILRTPRLFVEAKDLSADPHDRRWISQVLGYATVVGVEWCVLTNGDEYRLYNAHAAVDVDQKLFRSVRISDPASTEYTLDTLFLLSKDKMGEKLIDVLWRSHFIDHHVGQVLRGLLSEPDPALVRLIRKGRPELSLAGIRDSLKRAEVGIDFPAVPAMGSPQGDQGASLAKGESSPRSASMGQSVERYVLRRQFWTQLLEKARQTGSSHANAAPGKKSWLGASAGMPGLSFAYVIGMTGDARVELYIDQGDFERNKRIFDHLLACRQQVESVFGAELEWQRLEGKRASRVCYRLPSQGLRSRDGWPAVQQAMIDSMDRLAKAIAPEIEDLRKGYDAEATR